DPAALEHHHPAAGPRQLNRRNQAHGTATDHAYVASQSRRALLAFEVPKHSASLPAGREPMQDTAGHEWTGLSQTAADGQPWPAPADAIAGGTDRACPVEAASMTGRPAP